MSPFVTIRQGDRHRNGVERLKITHKRWHGIPPERVLYSRTLSTEEGTHLYEYVRVQSHILRGFSVPDMDTKIQPVTLIVNKAFTINAIGAILHSILKINTMQ